MRTKFLKKCEFCREIVNETLYVWEPLHECCSNCESVFNTVRLRFMHPETIPSWVTCLKEVSPATLKRIKKAVKLFEVERVLDGEG